MSDLELIRAAVLLIVEKEEASEEWAIAAMAHGLTRQHNGDCTGLPMSCFSCLADDYLERVRGNTASHVNR